MPQLTRSDKVVLALCAVLELILVISVAYGSPDTGLDLPVTKPEKPSPTVLPGVFQRTLFGREIKPQDLPPPPPTEQDSRPPTFYGTEIRSSHATLYYVVDVSGSMAWDVVRFTDETGAVRDGNRLDRAKAELARSIATLPESFRFNVSAYDCSVSAWSPELAPADPEHKSAALGWVRGLRALGGTGTGPAVVLALGAGTSVVVLLTDGAPNCQLGGLCGSATDLEWHRSLIRDANRARGSPAAVDVFGIGATGAWREFCLDVATDNGGFYQDVR